ncbi:MAG: OmpA family protein [Treponema sp.]|jgi:outer membrane protein OmpA-like peptidoglycan-associated protein|nr:OmpA family protein [Treponema sp.]
MKKLPAALFILSAVLLLTPDVDAQTAAELERVLALPAVSYGDAVWFVLSAAGTVLPETAERSAGGAYRFAADNNWFPKKAAAETPVTLGGVSLLIMKSFNIKGGFMYSLFSGSRYAYRELTYRKIIGGRAYSTMTVSGAHLLRIIGRALDYSGDTAALAAEAAATVSPATEPTAGPPADDTAAMPVASLTAEASEIPADDTPVVPPPVDAAQTPVEAPVVEPMAPPVTEPAIPPKEKPVPPAREERERLVEIIHTELEEKSVSGTEVRATDEGVTISLNNIQFLPDSTELTEVEKQKLQNIAVILNEFPGRKILVGGHAAMAGSAEGRIMVSTARAQAVTDYLVGLGCRKRDEITVRGYGAERPLGDPATAEGQARSRRVEITLLDEGSGG